MLRLSSRVFNVSTVSQRTDSSLTRPVANAYEFLYSLLAAGTSISTPAQPYIGFLPPPTQIALAASLIPHKFKTVSADNSKGSDTAYRYLQCLLSTIDAPAYPYIRQAFTFPADRTRRRPRGHRSGTRSLSPDEDDDVDHLYCEVANEKSLWYRAEDFWHIVGWAFNCSVAYKKRWERWSLWLKIMLDLLEADWEVCVKQSQRDESDGESMLQRSLIWLYVAQESQAITRTTRRRMVKAIYATASAESLRDYAEVWENETTDLTGRANKRQKLGNVDFENGEVADYDSDEEMKDAPQRVTRAIERKFEVATLPDLPDINNGKLTIHNAIERVGGSEAIALRQRLLALVSQYPLPNKSILISCSSHK